METLPYSVIKCTLTDAIKCFVLANESEITLFKISLIKRIFTCTKGLIFRVEELSQIITLLCSYSNDSKRYKTQENYIFNICLLVVRKINLFELVHLLYLKL